MLSNIALLSIITTKNKTKKNTAGLIFVTQTKNIKYFQNNSIFKII